MKPKQIFWGTLFISLGILLLSESIFSTEIDLSAGLKFWPFIFVFIGLSMITKDQKVKSIFAGLAGLASGAVLFGMLTGPRKFFEYRHHGKRGDVIVEKFVHPNEKDVKNFSFKLSGGAGSYSISAADSNLVKIEGEDLNNRYNIDFEASGENARLDMSMNEINIDLNEETDYQNDIDIALNPAPAYSIDVEIGAAAAHFDLSKFKMNNLDVKVGAASLDINLGEPLKERMDANISCGVSTVRVVCKKEFGVELKLDSPLSTKNLTGFENVSDKIYRSDNFNSSSKKIYLTLEGGVSNFDIVMQ